MKQYAQTDVEVHRLCRGGVAAQSPDGASTRADYTSAIYRHIMWFFGPVKMRDIGPGQRCASGSPR